MGEKKFTLKMQGTAFKKCFVLLLSGCSITGIHAQHTCPTIAGRNNGNGQSNNCPGVGGTLIATNVIAAYLGVPAGSKTGDIIWKHVSTDAWYTNPPVILAAYTTSSGTSAAINSYPGPPGVPSSGNVKYCFYAGASGNGNLPNAGIVSFRFASPINIADYMVCTYDFGSNGLIANPASVPVAPLLVHFNSFTAKHTAVGAELAWSVSGNNNEVARYSVERSADGVNFSEIYSTSAVQEQTYSFTDVAMPASKAYYRVRETDYDGQSVTTAIETVAVADAQGLTMGFAGDALVIRSSDAVNGVLQYIDMAGRVTKQEAQTLSAGVNKFSADMDIPAPVVVRLIAGDKVYVCKYGAAN